MVRIVALAVGLFGGGLKAGGVGVLVTTSNALALTSQDVT
jgi:hypothetical protein